jgi:copper homeostasis protein (lipoprotein)
VLKMRIVYYGLAVLLALRVLNTAVAQSGIARADQAEFPGGLPARFTGVLPCADCPGIDYLLDLNSNHTYTLRMTYEERNAYLDESGTWSLDSAAKKMTLHSHSGSAQRYAVRDADTLRQLDIHGNEIESKLNFDLKREQPSVSSADKTLENTAWKLVELGGKPVTGTPKEAYIQLDPASHRVSGSGGCNRLMGSYTTNGDQLQFGQMAGTRMACAQGMDTEHEFLQAS